MNPVKIAVSGLAAGAALMYLCDPDRGKRRRALIRDQSARAAHGFSNLLDKARRDASNRVRGVACEIQGVFRGDDSDDAILGERVRSRLGRLVSHPHAIEASVQSGRVVLRGLILEAEVPHLLIGIRAVPGVREVENQLEAHESDDHISSLQGGVPRGSRFELMQQNWTPALRIAAGAVGGGLMLYGARKDGLLGVAGGIVGTGLLGRAVCNRELREIVGLGDGARAVEFDKAIHIHAPVDQVYGFWEDLEKLPRFMAHLKEVRDLGDGKSRWTADGPAGIPISWDAEITRRIPNKLLEWRSVPGAAMETEGTVRFDPDSNSGTRVGIRMFYKPPAGVLGHYVASLFGADPKHEMDDDMVRLKSLLEFGHTHAHGARVSLDALT